MKGKLEEDTGGQNLIKLIGAITTLALPPGMISIWWGWTRLMNMVEDYQFICG